MSEGMPTKLGRYEVVRELGKGAMGVVYEGRDPNIGRRVAIKTARRDVLEKAGGRASELLERFLREAQALGSINHPNILTVYDADEQDDMAYIAMEFMTGGDLGDWMKKHRSIEPEQAVEICAKVASALHAVHDSGIVHRDIKPDNIMVLENGEIKVADFGIAHVSDSNLTQEGSMIGTPHYMSPEQFQGKKVDGRTDLWAVGVMLYEMLTKEKPFDGDSVTTVMTRCMRVDPVPPHELDVMIPEALSRVCMKALSKSPTTRYQTGEDLAAAMREATKETPDPAVLKLGTAMEATVVPGGGGADATLIAGGEATVVGDAPAAPVPGDQATVVGDAPASPSAAETVRLEQEATKAGGLPPNAEPGSTVPAGAIPAATGATAGTLAGSVAAPKKGLPIGMIAAAVVVVLVLGIGGWAVFGGGGGGEMNGTPGQTAEIVPTYSSVQLNVRKLDDPAFYQKWMDAGDDGVDLGALPRAVGATVNVWDKPDGELLKSITIPDGERDLTFKLDTPVTKAPYIEITLSGYSKDTVPSATSPEEAGQTFVVETPRVLLSDSL